jgi:predicted metal-binding membrane protein
MEEDCTAWVAWWVEFAAVLLIAAGLFQLTPPKNYCLTRYRSPSAC